MADIFISYRRDDAKADAGRLYDRLARQFGHKRVFMDVDDIPPGTDFVQHLKTTLADCGAVLVVIGDQWLLPDDKTGRSRLADPGDFVHLEIRTALERGVPVVPVLVGGAKLPALDELPDDLAPLLNRQAVELRHARFSDDVDQLVESMSGQMNLENSGISRRVFLAGLSTAALAGAGYAGYRALFNEAVHLRSEPARLTVDGAKAMLVRQDFYDARWNAAGRGAGQRLESSVAGDEMVVVDHRTHLMWQRAGTGSAQVLADTRATLHQLNESGYSGFNDWRLPTLEEAMSLMRAEPTAHWHIDPAFDSRAAPFIWTADRPGSDTGWVVYYFDGICAPESDRFNAHVRAVRASGRSW